MKFKEEERHKVYFFSVKKKEMKKTKITKKMRKNKKTTRKKKFTEKTMIK